MGRSTLSETPLLNCLPLILNPSMVPPEARNLHDMDQFAMETRGHELFVLGDSSGYSPYKGLDVSFWSRAADLAKEQVVEQAAIEREAANKKRLAELETQLK